MIEQPDSLGRKVAGYCTQLSTCVLSEQGMPGAEGDGVSVCGCTASAGSLDSRWSGQLHGDCSIGVRAGLRGADKSQQDPCSQAHLPT